MNQRARELIRILNLAPHPEGGAFCEIYRSPLLVTSESAPASRSALTNIYFLLQKHEISRWHKVDADETWHFYEGSLLELFDLDLNAGKLVRVQLGSVTSATKPVYTVPAHHWQAARPVDE